MCVFVFILSIWTHCVCVVFILSIWTHCVCVVFLTVNLLLDKAKKICKKFAKKLLTELYGKDRLILTAVIVSINNRTTMQSLEGTPRLFSMRQINAHYLK